jgi:gliding motility-associated-like protein
MRKLLLISAFASFIGASAQNPATTFTIPNRNVQLSCGTTCLNITASVPHIKQSSNYVITNPAYVPFAYTTTSGTVVSSVYIDDTWSPKIPISFPFCFYNITYPTLLMGSNSAITFDSARAGSGSGYSISATGAIPNTFYAPAMIFGPYHDIHPGLSSANKKIEYRVEGTAPKRRFVASYNDVPYFGSLCTVPRATHQMVLYESTGIIEVYIKDKPYCTDWNSGRTILGVQDETRTKAVAATGKNATVWGTNAMDSCFRFIPSGGTSSFKSAQLRVNGNVVATGDTISGAAGVLNLNFNNVCPTADSTAYVLRVTYSTCNNPALDVFFEDTVFVKKITPAFTFTKTDATCSTGGTINVAASGGIAPLQYSINGTNYQASASFTNVQAGNYTIYVKDAGNCIVTQPTNITLTNNLTVRTNNDTTICRGASFIPNTVSTPAGATFTWTPSTGATGTQAPNPFLSPQSTTTYTVTATLGACTATDNLVVTVVPGATANAGPDKSIIAGDVYTIFGTASAGTYNWTPSAGLSSANTLSTNASPTQTTTYTLTVTSPQGCTASDDITLTVIPYCVKPMIAFTPNSDGINDLWLITNGNCLISAKAQVFNRYGAKVFEANDYKNNWNGTYEGKPVPDGTYYYVITYKLVNGKTVFEKGNVTILR